MKRLTGLAALLATVASVPGPAFAWGGSGHRLIGEAAARALPPDLPAFLRTRQSIEDIAQYALEPDNSKNSGKQRDLEMQSAHFLDIDENGRLLGGPPSTDLPVTRDLYETSLRDHGLDSWKVGYLPYSIIERWQVLAKDFATWRVIVAAQSNRKWRANRAYYTAERRRREALILIHIGELAHYVGDGSQPLHASTHFNGWGAFPNPNGYTQAKIHAPFEGDFVTSNLTLALVEARMTPPAPCGCAIEPKVTAYLNRTSTYVEPLYQLEKAGALRDGDPRMIAFAAERLGAGASETRDMVIDAWRASPRFLVGWRPVKVADVVSGKVEPYKALRVLD